MNITIILPAYNEEAVMADTLDAHIHWKPPSGVRLLEILVIDDGSSDQTPAIVHSCASRHTIIRLISHSVNQGKGSAIKTGVSHANGSIIGCVDSDLAYPPDVYDAFIHPLAEGAAEITVGNRYHSDLKSLPEYSFIRKLASKSFKNLVHAMGLSVVNDTQCGIKFFSAQSARFLFQNLESPGYLYDLEILWMAQLLRFNINEIPVDMRTSAISNIKVHQQFGPVIAEMFRLIYRRATKKSPRNLRKAWDLFQAATSSSIAPSDPHTPEH